MEGSRGRGGVGTIRESALWFSSVMLLAFSTDAHCADGRAPALCSLLFISCEKHQEKTTAEHRTVFFFQELIRGPFYLKSEIHVSLIYRCVPNISAAHLLTLVYQSSEETGADSGVNIILRHVRTPHYNVNSWLKCAALSQRAYSTVFSN